MAGGLQRNKTKRVDASAKDVKIKESQRNCLIDWGYKPIS